MPSWMIKELPPLGRVLRLRLSGELDATGARGLAEALVHTGRRHDHVALEVSGVERLSVAGLRAIARDEHDRAVHGGSLTLQDPTAHVQRELARAGLLRLTGAASRRRASA